MRHIRLFEEWTERTANLQRVKVTAPDSNGTLIMFGHLLEEDELYFIPEEGGFKWIHKQYPTPDYVVGIKRRFDKSAEMGRKLKIAVGERGMGDSFAIDGEHDNLGSEITIEDLIIGERGVKIDYA